jgi:hypothetical protein
VAAQSSGGRRRDHGQRLRRWGLPWSLMNQASGQ